jgi:hypothetical protein
LSGADIPAPASEGEALALTGEARPPVARPALGAAAACAWSASQVAAESALSIAN